jgi:transcriptional regulator with XRE-family HTH domain
LKGKPPHKRHVRDPEPVASGNAPTLGKVMRRLRQRSDWTLKEMSERTGIPFSTLSKVEHDRLTLTYDKLMQISQRLGIRMSDLFAEGSPGQVTARRSIGRLDHSLRVETANYDYHYLCTELRHKRMIPVITRIRARSIDEFGELIRHPGEEFIYVLEGRIVVHTDHYDAVALEQGGSIYLDSTMGHAYLVDGDCREAVVLAVCSSAEDNLMDSLMNLHGDGVYRMPDEIVAEP